MKLGIGIAGAVLVGIIWTCWFGTLWQWVPIVAGCAMGLAVKRAMKGGWEQ